MRMFIRSKSPGAHTLHVYNSCFLRVLSTEQSSSWLPTGFTPLSKSDFACCDQRRTLPLRSNKYAHQNSFGRMTMNIPDRNWWRFDFIYEALNVDASQLLAMEMSKHCCSASAMPR